MELMPHQQEIVHISSFEPNLYLNWDMGTGKTCATIQILRSKYEDYGKLVPTLIIAPSVVMYNWKEEFLKFSQVPGSVIKVLDGTVAKRTEQITLEIGPKIFITNYNAFDNKEFVKAVKKYGFKILVCDEAHNLKGYKSKRAINIADISRDCRHRYLLSGTAILNSPMDLFMQYNVLDGHLGKDSTFGTKFYHFRGHFFEDANARFAGRQGYFPKFVSKPGSSEELNFRLIKKTSIVKKEAVLKDLPPLVTLSRLVDLGPEQKKAYKEMKNELVTFIDKLSKAGEPLATIAKMAVTKAMRLQQIVSGYMVPEDMDGLKYAPHIFENNPRLDVLSDLLSELTPNHKVIVWCSFKENYSMVRLVCQRLGIESREIHGGISSEGKYQAANDFNNQPQVRVLIGNPSAGGVGVNLIAASYAIYYSRTFKLGDDLQSEARNHRKGSEIHEKITRINIIATNTIDKVIEQAILRKQDIAAEIMTYGAKK